MMQLVLSVSSPAPPKSAWDDPDPSSRGEWSRIYEAITTWFCSSHDFNKEDNLFVLYQDTLIKFEGSTLRYLGPSLRSAASLTSKAFNKLDTSEPVESSPGVFVIPHAKDYKFPRPHYQLVLGNSMGNQPRTGTIFSYPTTSTMPIILPGDTIPQALVWYLQERGI